LCCVLWNWLLDSRLLPFYQWERDSGFTWHKFEWVPEAFWMYSLYEGSNTFIQPTASHFTVNQKLIVNKKWGK
jgi:hypothetical protein